MTSERSPQRLDAGERSPAQRTLTSKQIASGTGIVLVLVFALINMQDVTMHWIVGTTHTRLIVLVAICVLIGGGVGFLVARRTHKPPSPPS